MEILAQNDDNGLAVNQGLILDGLECLGLTLVLIVSGPSLTVACVQLADGLQDIALVEAGDLLLELAGAEHLNSIAQSAVAGGGALVLNGGALLDDQVHGDSDLLLRSGLLNLATIIASDESGTKQANSQGNYQDLQKLHNEFLQNIYFDIIIIQHFGHVVNGFS